MDAKARKQGEFIQGHGHGHMNGDSFKEINGISKDDMSSLTIKDELTSPDDVKIVGGRQDGSVEDDSSVKQTCNGMLEDTSELYTNSKSAIRASFGHQDRPHPATRPTVEGVKSIDTRKERMSKHIMIIRMRIRFSKTEVAWDKVKVVAFAHFTV